MFKQHQLVFSLSIFSLLGGCGGTDFAGAGGSESNQGKEPNPPSADANDFHIAWNWSCDDTTTGLEVEENRLVLKGPGPHIVDPTQVDGASVVLSGQACGATDVERDIVFVIDVSGSMYDKGGVIFGPSGTDPIVNGTCGRYEALEAVMSVVRENSKNARFSVVTFSSNVEQESRSFYSDKGGLYSDLLSQSSFSNPVDLICAGLGDTNYNAALAGAERIFDSFGAPGRMREIYFISDGAPTNGNHGSDIARRLHENTTIATVMAGGGNDSILKNNIASRDQYDIPLHARAENSSKLAEILAGFASNTVVSAKMFYGATGASDPTEVDFTSSLVGSNFEFEAFSLDPSSAPSGVTVELEYVDRYGDTREQVGKLEWAK